MKKLALALTAAAAVVLGSAGIAGAYPPGGPGITAVPATGVAGYSVTVTVKCTSGETVTIKLDAITATAPCSTGTALLNNAAALVGGTATGVVTAPTTPGTYVGTATGSISGALGTFSVVVEGATAPTPGLPATGSNGTSSMTTVAGGLLLVALGMFGVFIAGRRQDAAAA